MLIFVLHNTTVLVNKINLSAENLYNESLLHDDTRLEECAEPMLNLHHHNTSS